MHPYISHLLSDIAAAHRTEFQEEKFEQSLEEQFEEIERWVSGEDEEHTFGYYCGLKSEDFPPPHQLSDKEMKMVLKAFEEMMHSWNQEIDLPKKIPAAFAYQLIVDCLNKTTAIVNSGSMSFDFCTGYAPGCELKEYCPCLKIWNNDDENHIAPDVNRNGNSLPF